MRFTLLSHFAITENHAKPNTNKALAEAKAAAGESRKILFTRTSPCGFAFARMTGAKIGNNGAIIAPLRPLRLRAFASNSLCQHALATNH